MLPRKIPNWLLVILCVGSLALYLLIKLVLAKIPAIFYGADVIADVVMNVLLAFFTAFPFWWLIEWFERRKQAREAGEHQKAFLDNLAYCFDTHFKVMIGAQTLNPFERIYYLSNWTGNELEKEMLRTLTEQSNNFYGEPDRKLTRLFCARSLAAACRGVHSAMQPYSSAFPRDFNLHMTQVMHTLENQTTFTTTRSSDPTMNYDHSKATSAFLVLRNDLFALDDMYRSHNGMALQNLPADRPNRLESSGIA